MDTGIHTFDRCDRQKMVLAVWTILLGQFDRVAFEMIDDADFFATGRDDVHAFLYSGDTKVRASLTAFAHAGLLFYKIGGLFGPLGNLVPRVLRRIGDKVPCVRGFILDLLAMIGLLIKWVLASEFRCHVPPYAMTLNGKYHAGVNRALLSQYSA